MPRKGRLHIPGGYYHVIGRGLERRFVFSEVEDKEEFLSRLGENLSASGTQCLAWALMSNHYHLLLQVGHLPLSKLMAPVLGGFAGSYNRRHDRSGYVFQNRYQSILVDADSYLLELIRYIHLNPLQARIVENLRELANYRWTGHAGLFGNHVRAWHEADVVLSLFGKSRSQALTQYRQFMSATCPSGHKLNLSGGGVIRSAGGWEALSRARKEHRSCIGDERILGGSEFVQKALAEDNLMLDQRATLLRSGWNLDRLINAVCVAYGIEEYSLAQKTRSKRSSIAKSLVCYWGSEILGLSVLEIGRSLGMSGPAASYRARKGREYCSRGAASFEDLLS